jgi:NAD(P)-dependent dehydrogenase (short-subunit alcohol dehydrogenase family)
VGDTPSVVGFAKLSRTRGIRVNAILPGLILTPMYLAWAAEGKMDPSDAGNATNLKRCAFCAPACVR